MSDTSLYNKFHVAPSGSLSNGHITTMDTSLRNKLHVAPSGPLPNGYDRHYQSATGSIYKKGFFRYIFSKLSSPFQNFAEFFSEHSISIGQKS